MRFRSFDECATVAGHYLWFETRLFEVLGAWAAVEGEPPAKLAFGSQSFRHAWHADLWRRRLPVLAWPGTGGASTAWPGSGGASTAWPGSGGASTAWPGSGGASTAWPGTGGASTAWPGTGGASTAGAGWQPDLLAVPPDDGFAAFGDALAETSARHETLERLVGAYRVATPHLVNTYRGHLEGSDPVNEGPTIRWLDLMVADELDAWRSGERLLEKMLRNPDDVHRAASHQAALEALLVKAGPIGGG